MDELAGPRGSNATRTDLLSVLEAEHEQIERALDVLEVLCDRLDAGKDVPDADREALLRFIQRYADRSHHGKEEEVLFPGLQQAGMARDSGPLEVMLEEHGLGRALVSQMASAPGGDAWAHAARSYVELLRDHILKENEVLFPMGRNLLPGPALDELMPAALRMEAMMLADGEKLALESELGRLVATYVRH